MTERRVSQKDRKHKDKSKRAGGKDGGSDRRRKAERGKK